MKLVAAVCPKINKVYKRSWFYLVYGYILRYVWRTRYTQKNFNEIPKLQALGL